jgi:hypothetical protein
MTVRETARKITQQHIDQIKANLDFLEEVPDFGQVFEMAGDIMITLIFDDRTGCPLAAKVYFEQRGYHSSDQRQTEDRWYVTMKNGNPNQQVFLANQGF